VQSISNLQTPISQLKSNIFDRNALIPTLRVTEFHENCLAFVARVQFLRYPLEIVFRQQAAGNFVRYEPAMAPPHTKRITHRFGERISGLSPNFQTSNFSSFTHSFGTELYDVAGKISAVPAPAEFPRRFAISIRYSHPNITVWCQQLPHAVECLRGRRCCH
jgi:hypothetical protein